MVRGEWREATRGVHPGGRRRRAARRRRRPGGWASSTGCAAPTTRRSRSTPAPRSTASEPAEEALLYAWIASAHYHRGDVAESAEAAEKALELARRLGDARALAAAHTAIGMSAELGQRLPRRGARVRPRARASPSGPATRSRRSGSGTPAARSRSTAGDVTTRVRRRSTRPSASPTRSASPRSTPGRSSTAAGRTRASAGSRRRWPTSRPPARSTTGSARRRSPTRSSARARSTCCAATRCSRGSRSRTRSAPRAARATPRPSRRRSSGSPRRSCSTSRSGPASCRPRAWRSAATWRRSPSCSGAARVHIQLGEREAARRLAREATNVAAARQDQPGYAAGLEIEAQTTDRPGRGRAAVRARPPRSGPRRTSRTATPATG